ncbi:helix-turn-helix domain-containing protein [Streptomyces sp. NPDC058961]|uniref:helix-turn-helix domain-containing protein n=1 Tax=Streptomyces sp. NPDC058961 TaxID=3346680 RepID=UPI0036B48B1D
MDAAHPIWRSVPMQDAVACSETGVIVRLARRAADLTLAELGRQVGYTAASISRMERGKQPMRDVVLLRRVATILGIPPHLLGLACRHERAIPPPSPAHRPPVATRVVGPEPSFGEEGENSVQRRNLLAGLAGAATSAVFGPSPQASAQPSLSGLEDLLLYRHAPDAHGPDPTPATVAAAVDAARHDFGACRYEELARALPARIALAQALGSVGHPAQAAVGVAELYNTATRLCIKLGEDGLAAVTADRALTAALNGADALTVAEAHGMVSSAWRRSGHLARATDVAVRAAQQLAADRTTPEPERLSVQGNLYATAAYTAAKQGDRRTAHVLIAEAKATADQLGRDDTLHGAVFGPSQVLLHQISISHLLGDAGQAIEHARSVNATRLPTRERQARYWIDIARSFDQWGKPERCYRALLAAEQAAGQEVRRAAVRTMSASLLRYDRTLPGVRAFANRVGALT